MLLISPCVPLRIFLSWAVDFSQLLIVWIVAIGAVVALHRNEHLAIGYIKEKFPKKIELGIDLLTRLILVVFYVILIDTGLEIADIRMNIDYVTLGWPYGICFLVNPGFRGLHDLFRSREAVLAFVKQLASRTGNKRIAKFERFRERTLMTWENQ